MLAHAWTPCGGTSTGPGYSSGAPAYFYGPAYPQPYRGPAPVMPPWPNDRLPRPIADRPGDWWGAPMPPSGPEPFGDFPASPWDEMPPMGPPPGFDEPPWGMPASAARPSVMRGIHVLSVQTADDAYLITLDTGGGKPEEVQVSPAGRGLMVSRTTEEQTERDDNLDGGRGYRHSFSFSHGSSSRRIPLPPDANLAGMTRESSDGNLRLRIPRVANQSYGWGQAPRPPGGAGGSGGANQ